MKLYQLQSKKLKQIPIQSFKLEKDIQNLVEDNLESLFDLELVKSELKVQNFRLDTLCFDPSTNAFVIIEYKKTSSYSVIDQGYTYLSLLLNNKADFILEYNERLNKNLKRDQVDWSQSRILFISPKFSAYQKHSINFKNVPFELWEITRFNNNTIGLNLLETDSEVDINTATNDILSNNPVKEVSKEIVKYDEDFHLTKNKNRPEEIVELYYYLKERILSLDENIELKFKKQTIGVKQYRTFADLIIYNKRIGVVLNMKKGELKDYKGLTEDISEKGHWGNGDYRIWIKTTDEADYAMELVKQSFMSQRTFFVDHG